MSEHMLRSNMICILSELMLHKEMWYVRTYVTHENLMSYVRICYIPKCEMSEPCYTWKYDVSCPNLCYMSLCEFGGCRDLKP